MLHSHRAECLLPQHLQTITINKTNFSLHYKALNFKPKISSLLSNQPNKTNKITKICQIKTCNKNQNSLMSNKFMEINNNKERKEYKCR